MTIRWAALFLIVTAAGGAQAPQFDAASIKPSTVSAVGFGGCAGGPGSTGPGIDAGHWNCHFITLGHLVAVAYGMDDPYVVHPDWMDNERFDIAATIPEGATAAQLRLMAQNLLATRFNLLAHQETRSADAWQLQAAKGGLKIKPAADVATPGAPGAAAPPRPDAPPGGANTPVDFGNGLVIPMPPMVRPGTAFPVRTQSSDGTYATRVLMWHVTMDYVAAYFSRTLHAPFTNATGVEGFYTFAISYAAPGGSPAPSDGSAPLEVLPATAQDALAPELGLRLVKLPSEAQFLIVDRCDKQPSGN